MSHSLVHRLVLRDGADGFMAKLTPEERAELPFNWRAWGRPEQFAPPGSWRFFLAQAGRGFGKSRLGAEWVREKVRQLPGSHGALVAPTPGEAREVMISGPSGILACSPERERPLYEPSKRLLTWPLVPGGGQPTTAGIYSAFNFEQMRGPQYAWAWCFVAGTMVATEFGDVPIEALRPGDTVLTRVGPRKILGVSKRLDSVGTVRFKNGASLTGTAQHPVLTQHGWTMLGDLNPLHQVFAGARPSMGTSSAISRGRPSTSTGGCGNFTTAQSRLDSRFTIEAGSATTTECRTLRCFRAATTSPGTLMSAGPLAPSALSADGGWSSDVSQPSPSARPARHAKRKVGGRGHPVPAYFAGWSSPAGPGTFAVNVASTWEPAGQAEVFDLAVEDAREFFANGIVVHNCDELGKWKYPTEAFDQLNFGLRLGVHPQACITTTPRPIAIIRKLLRDKRCQVTRGSTYDNVANLADDYLADMRDKYEGSRMGRQELEGELLDDVPGALWKRGPMIDAHRLAEPPYARATGTGALLSDKLGRPIPDMDEIVVGVDPSVADHETEEAEDERGLDLCGIVVVGRKGAGLKATYYVLEDATVFGSPDVWSDRVAVAYERWRANRVVAEVNNGGALVEAIIRQKSNRVKYRAVHASRGKRTRAEPVSVLYEQGRVHHVGVFEELEDQMCQFTANSSKSPDALDALVWAISDLSESSGSGDRLSRLVSSG